MIAASYPVRRDGLGPRRQCLITLDGYAVVKQQSFLPQAFCQPGASHNIEHAGIEPGEPKRCPAFGHAAVIAVRALQTASEQCKP